MNTTITATTVMMLIEQARLLLTSIDMDTKTPHDMIALGDQLQDRQLSLITQIATTTLPYNDPEMLAAMREITAIEALINEDPVILNIASMLKLERDEYQKLTFERIKTQVYYPTMLSEMHEFRKKRDSMLRATGEI